MIRNRDTGRTQTSSILGLLGLAVRARKVRGGATAAEAMIRSGQARLVLVARDSAEGTKRLFTRLAGTYGVPLLEQHTREEYGRCLGGAPRAVLAIMDNHFAAGMMHKADKGSLRTGRRH